MTAPARLVKATKRVGLLAGLLAGLSGGAARAEVDGGVPPPAAPAPAPVTATPKQEAAAKQTAEAASAGIAIQQVEAQVIELRRTVEALERQRAAYDDLRRQLDEINLRLAETERRDGGDFRPDDGDRQVLRFREGGFSVRSPDRRFLLRPHLRIQTVYEGALASAGPMDQLDGVSADPDRSTFYLAHAEVILEGHALTQAFEYRLQLDVAEPQVVKDAFVQWRMARTVGLRAGQFKVPYGLQPQYWTAELEFVDLATPTQVYSRGWDLGLEVVGRPLAGRLQYELGVLNGTGGITRTSSGRNENFDMAYAARIVAAPFGPLPSSEGDIEGHERPLVSVGVSGYYNLVPTDILLRTPGANVDVDRDGRIDNVAIWQGGMELRAVWRGAGLQGEWFSRAEEPGAAGPARKYWGAYLQASYFVVPRRLQIGGRISRTNLPLFGLTNEERALRGTRIDEQSAVVSAYFRGWRGKLQVDYSHLEAENAGTAPTSHRVRAAVQLGF